MFINRILLSLSGLNSKITSNSRYLDVTDKEIVNSLLTSVTKQWTIMDGTSIEGLQESFLQRNGTLQEDNKQFILKIEQKGFDMLLDHIPWNITSIQLDWMKKNLLVEWR